MFTTKDSKINWWNIWCKSESDVERWNPEFSRDGRLRFLVVIRDGYTATPTDARSIDCQTEDVGESRLTASTFVQPECCITASTSVQTPLLPSACLESLSDDLSRYMDRGSDPDVEFECGGQSTAAHGAVVCARSPVIASMLASDMLEGRTRVIKIPDIEPDVFHNFLRYMYTGTLPELTIDIALSLYEAGDQYAVLALARRCSEYLLEHLSVQDACEVLVVADSHSNAEFREAVIQFVVEKKVPQVFSGWPQFCSSHSTLAIEVLNRICNAVAE